MNMYACLQPFVCPVIMSTIPHSHMSLISALCQDNQTSPLLFRINQEDGGSGGSQLCKASMCAHKFLYVCMYLYTFLCMHLHTQLLMSIMPTAGTLCDVKSIVATTTNK